MEGRTQEEGKGGERKLKQIAYPENVIKHTPAYSCQDHYHTTC